MLFIGCDWEPGFPGGVYRSFDNGQSWDKIISGMTNNSVHKLCLSPDEYLYAITYAPSELFRSTMSTITEVHNIPQENEYPLIYPNPFTNKVTIELSENVYNTFIQINIYTIHGKLAGRFNFNNLSQMILTIDLQKLNLANGVYYLNYRTKEDSYTFKVLKAL